MKEKMDEESKKALIAYRTKRAYETLKEADDLSYIHRQKVLSILSAN